jgi:SAM-dependent methyltransferase
MVRPSSLRPTVDAMIASEPRTLEPGPGIRAPPRESAAGSPPSPPRVSRSGFGRGEEVPRIRELLDLRGGEHLLDVGGGSGRFTARFAVGCPVVIVLEPNAKRVARGRRRRATIRFDVGRGETIPFPENSFDCVTAIRSTHHMESADRFLSEAHRVLRPGGRILLEELQPRSWLARTVGRLLHSHHSGALDIRSPTEWTEALTRAGFGTSRALLGRRWFFAVGTKAPPAAP